jgi:iron complex outermembrane recepter protein
MKKFYFSTLLLMVFGVSFAQQTKITVQSQIENQDCVTDIAIRKVIIEKAVDTKNQIVGKFTITGCKGNFETALDEGQYKISVSTENFISESQTFTITTNQEPIVLAGFVLKSKTNNLKEVEVFGNKRQYIKVDSDKTTISVKSNGMLNSGNSLEAVKRLPGVITSPTGSITLNGRSVRIYIDDAPSTLTGNDLQNYLSSLPASAIEKIELIYNPGASFDANSSGSIINIITSSKRMKGVNASFNINYNFNKYQKPSPQVLLNGKEKNLSWQTMFGYNYIDSEELTRNSQTFTSFTPQKTLLQETFRFNTNRNLYFRLGTNYKLSKKSNLLFNYNGNFANDRSVYTSKTQNENIFFQDKGTSKTPNNNHEISLQFKTKLDTLGKTLDVIAFSNFFDRNANSNANTSINTVNKGDVKFRLNNNYVKYDFVFPFQKQNFTVSTGGKYNTILVKNDGFYTINNTPSEINFDYSENNLAFYVEARKKIKKFNFTAGLRYEDFSVSRKANTLTNEIKFNNRNFFPNLSLLYEFTNDINFSMAYSKKIQQPDYNSLDPNNNSTFNQYNTSAGNLNLQPTFFDNFEAKITALQFVQLGINYTIGRDDNRFVFSAKPNELVSNQSFQQFDKIKTFGAFASFPIPLDYFFKGKEEFEKRMNTIEKMNYIFVNVNYVKSTIEGYSFPFNNKAITNYGFQAQIICPWEITSTLNYFIVPKGTWEIYQIEKPIQQFDISLNRDFLNKNLKVGIHCFDVFNANEVNALISGENLDTRFYQKRDSRNFRISLTYNFGNLKLQKEDTSINNEKNKQGGGLIK